LRRGGVPRRSLPAEPPRMAALRRHAAPAHLRVLGPRVGGDAHARARRDRAMGYSEPEWSGLWPAARDRGRPRRNRLRPRARPGAARGQDSPATGFELLTRGTGSGAAPAPDAREDAGENAVRSRAGAARAGLRVRRPLRGE